MHPHPSHPRYAEQGALNPLSHVAGEGWGGAVAA
jgi:hypothetical protein